MTSPRPRVRVYEVTAPIAIAFAPVGAGSLLLACAFGIVVGAALTRLLTARSGRREERDGRETTEPLSSDAPADADDDDLLEAVLGSMTEAIVLCNREGRVLKMSRSALELLDFQSSPGARKGQNFKILQDGRELTFNEMPLQRALTGLSMPEQELTLRVKGREDATIRASADPLRDASGRRVGAMVLFRDVTQAKRAELARRRLSQQIASHKRALDEFAIVAEMDKNGRITYVNENFCRISKYDREELLGRRHDILDSGHHPSEFFKELWGTVSSGTVWRGEIRNRAKDGTLYWVDTTIVPFLNREGKPRRYLSLRIPITQRKEAEAQRAELGEKLREASRQAGMAEVATGVLHNVGNVLTSINVSTELIRNEVRTARIEGMGEVAQLLRDQGEDLDHFLTEDPRGKHFTGYFLQAADHFVGFKERVDRELEALAGNVEHVKQVIQQQQTHARTAEIVETIDLHELVEQAVRTVQGAISRGDIRLEIELHDIRTIDTDRHKILQILVNLLSNAAEALTTTSHPTLDRVLRIEARRTEDDTIRLEVKDNGCGIAPKNLEKVFRHGFTTRRDGHGFGLHSCALSARHLGGELRAESDGEGRGATFTLEIPTRTAEEAIAC